MTTVRLRIMVDPPILSLCRNIFELSPRTTTNKMATSLCTWNKAALGYTVLNLHLSDGPTLPLYCRWRNVCHVSWETTENLVSAAYHADNLCDGAWISAGINMWITRQTNHNRYLTCKCVTQVTGRTSRITIVRIGSFECTVLEIVPQEWGGGVEGRSEKWCIIYTWAHFNY